jgi:hypothetical protein
LSLGASPDWNVGMMDHWNNGFGGMKLMAIDDFLLLTPNIPLSHYSIIPEL